MKDDQRPERLRQAERYGGPASDGLRRPGAQGPSVASAYLGGVLMIAATLITGALGAPALLAFLFGLVVFVITVFAMLPSRSVGGLRAALDQPIIVDRAAAVAAGLDPDRAERRLQDADAQLKRIEAIAAAQRNHSLADTLRDMTGASRDTLRALGEDPGDIDRARKFLVVVIPSALASAEKFQGLEVRDAELEARFSSLMAEVAEAARRQLSALRRDDEMALEVEMDVLADRLGES